MKLARPCLCAAVLCFVAFQAHAKGLTVDTMLGMQRVGEPDVSPDGKRVAFVVRDTDVAANRGRTDVWLIGIDGKGLRRLTTHAENDSSPRWSPDGRWVYFLSSRTGSAQVWRIAVAGGEADQVTRVPNDVNGFLVFPDGPAAPRLVLAMDVWPDAKTLAESAARDATQAKSKVKARVYDELLFRHWDQWEDGKYGHLFVWTPPERGGKADEAVDVTPGQTTDTPTHPFGGMEEVSIAPDGKTLAYIARVSGHKNAWKTNTDVFLVSTDGKSKPVNVTADSPGYDLGPTFSPDGRSLALRRMKRAGYEADRERIAIVDLASRKTRIVTEAWDRSANSLTWTADGKTLLTEADDVGNHALFSVDAATGAVKTLVAKGTNSGPKVAGGRVVFSRDTLSQPAELFTCKLDGSDLRQLTHVNDARVKAITWGAYEPFTFKGAKGDTVHGFVMKPAGHDGGKAPVAFLIHGGPQGSFGDQFHYRWNPQIYAGRGYGVIFIDVHGSTGYGQAFTDSIRGDWGGAPYEDLMLGLDAALAKYPWLDGTRMAALGASYGGFMINWINGKTDRFKALVCHDGNLDERMAYFDTEELWFPEWDHGGVPWEKPEGFVKHNPIDHVKHWKTPTLVIHGALDFRVVDTQGMSTFTALRRKGVPARFLHFPDENHWVLKPQNSKLWHSEVLGWLDRWTKPSARQ